jgi:hypothetical protein
MADYYPAKRRALRAAPLTATYKPPARVAVETIPAVRVDQHPGADFILTTNH